MKRALLLLVAGLMMAGAAAAADMMAAAPEQALIDLEAAWSKAFTQKDTAFLSNTLADDWNGQDSSGVRLGKADLVGQVSSGQLTITSMANRDVTARIMGNFAIVQGMDDEHSSFAGKDTSGTYSWTDVFANRGGRWVAVASQVTKVEK